MAMFVYHRVGLPDWGVWQITKLQVTKFRKCLLNQQMGAFTIQKPNNIDVLSCFFSGVISNQK